MGLDMYLNKDIYIGAYFQHRKVEADIKIVIEGKEISINPSQIETITERIGYWRKAHHIHEWIVENIQDGVDECQKTYISTKNLADLADFCNDYIDENPTGANSDDCQYTLDLLETIQEDKTGDTQIFYQSSW
jgi:hypothetical protein